MKKKEIPEINAEEQVQQTTEVPSETTETSQQEETTENDQQEKVNAEAQEAEIPAFVDNILRMNPQYDECYVDKSGFVYPKNAPKYQRKDATLYKNKYYKS